MLPTETLTSALCEDSVSIGYVRTVVIPVTFSNDVPNLAVVSVPGN